ncbi:MAG: hypothetical protein GX895_11695 [Clostridiales bacterium]|uniref:hypothetical protein n=1 Tax=Clostridium sp. N3C TaxID=1776758 RepID=UPI00092DEC1A|nr:hypothetical protein [Clostridium sp. N3C]NLZ49413.1 hypothetical protein [Clostridiales bacterium]SCN23370.1 hypothetical protein N3C_1270 [Clostridium sp. N3C]
MKKFVFTIALTLFTFLTPIKVIDAVSFIENPDKDFTSMIKEKRSQINEKVKENKDIQKSINQKSKEASDLYMLVFSGPIPPSDEDRKKVEIMEMELGSIAEQIALTEKAIARRIKSVNTYLKNQDYNEALSGYDSIINLMSKQYSNLKKQDETLSKYINFLQSLRHK